MTEKEKMLAHQWYDANYDPEIVDQRLKAQDLCFDLNQLRPSREKERMDIIEQLLHDRPEGLVLLSPVTFDYGIYTHIGKDTFINVNCYFMDGGTIHIGEHCFIGPYCGLYTANHAMNARERNAGLEIALPIHVGDNCWFGANVSVMPGVTIGDGCVIGAGSVVTKDLPANHVCAGVPCRPVRKIQQEPEYV